jgi:hypothetical protein
MRGDMNNRSHERIRLRAYQLWEDRGRPQDTSEIDWFKAEAEMRDAEPMSSKVARQVGAAFGSVVATVKATTRVALSQKHPNPLTFGNPRLAVLGRVLRPLGLV